MEIYADTNFVTRLYLDRPETNDALLLMRRVAPVVPITWLLQLEFINSLEQAVFSGFGSDQFRITREMAGACQQLFREDLKAGVAVRPVEVSLGALSAQFEELSLRHTAKHGFRSYDILHVSSALVLKCHTFWSYDKKASKLAKLEGLQTIS